MTVTSDSHSTAELEPKAAGAFGGADGFAVIIVEAGVEEGAPSVDPLAHRGEVGDAVGREAEMGSPTMG